MPFKVAVAVAVALVTVNTFQSFGAPSEPVKKSSWRPPSGRTSLGPARSRTPLQSGFFTGSSAVSAQQSQSVWDGIYTQEQAKRGEPLYSQACAGCHGSDLAGAEMAPPLAGGQFTSNWDTLSVGDLFERIRVSMPADNPGGLTRQQYADILAFVFSKGDFPAGKTEVSTKTEVLTQIKFEASKPERK